MEGYYHLSYGDISSMISCQDSTRKCLFVGICGGHLSYKCGEMPKYCIRVHAVGPLYRLIVVWRSQSVYWTLKTRFIVFTRERKLPVFLDPRLFGSTLHRSISVKYPGVIMDSWVKWKELLDDVVRILKILCGHAGVRVMWSGVWDPLWFFGFTSLSSGHPSPSHARYGDLFVSRHCQEETKQDQN